MNRASSLDVGALIPSRRDLLRRARAASALLAALLLAASLPGCGSDPCEDAVEALCEEACTCPGAAACGTTFGADGSGISLGFDDVADCAALFRAG